MIVASPLLSSALSTVTISVESEGRRGPVGVKNIQQERPLFRDNGGIERAHRWAVEDAVKPPVGVVVISLPRCRKVTLVESEYLMDSRRLTVCSAIKGGGEVRRRSALGGLICSVFLFPNVGQVLLSLSSSFVLGGVLVLRTVMQPKASQCLAAVLTDMRHGRYYCQLFGDH
jgi:hypothetical protein